MGLLEATLIYRPRGIGSEDGIPIGRTSDPRALQAVRDALVEEARQEALLWRDIDPGVLAIRTASFERLARILGFLFQDALPALRLVRPPSDRNVPS